MVPTVTPGKTKYQAVLSSEGLEFKEALKNTWDVRDRFKESRGGAGEGPEYHT